MASCYSPGVKPACNFFLLQHLARPHRPNHRPAGGRQSDVDDAAPVLPAVLKKSRAPSHPTVSILCSGPPPLAQLQSSPTARGTNRRVTGPFTPLRPRLAVKMRSQNLRWPRQGWLACRWRHCRWAPGFVAPWHACASSPRRRGLGPLAHIIGVLFPSLQRPPTTGIQGYTGHWFHWPCHYLPVLRKKTPAHLIVVSMTTAKLDTKLELTEYFWPFSLSFPSVGPGSSAKIFLGVLMRRRTVF